MTEIIGFEMSDPRLRGASVSGVEVTQNGQHAHVKIAVAGQIGEGESVAAEKEQKQAIQALEGASGFLRHELAVRLDLRLVPELHFTADRFPDADARVALLLKRAEKKRGRG